MSRFARCQFTILWGALRGGVADFFHIEGQHLMRARAYQRGPHDQVRIVYPAVAIGLTQTMRTLHLRGAEIFTAIQRYRVVRPLVLPTGQGRREASAPARPAHLLPQLRVILPGGLPPPPHRECPASAYPRALRAPRKSFVNYTAGASSPLPATTHSPSYHARESQFCCAIVRNHSIFIFELRKARIAKSRISDDPRTSEACMYRKYRFVGKYWMAIVNIPIGRCCANFDIFYPLAFADILLPNGCGDFRNVNNRHCIYWRAIKTTKKKETGKTLYHTPP